MRRLFALVLIMLLATPVAARQQVRLSSGSAPTAEEAGLRPGQPAPAAVPEAPPLNFSAPGGQSAIPAGLAFTRPLARTAADPVGSRNAAQCRAGCAQSHYFCLSAEDEQTCNPQWSRCVAGCS